MIYDKISNYRLCDERCVSSVAYSSRSPKLVAATIAATGTRPVFGVLQQPLLELLSPQRLREQNGSSLQPFR